MKLDFKDKAKPKVGSKDNAKHVPGGGTVKVREKKHKYKQKQIINKICPIFECVMLSNRVSIFNIYNVKYVKCILKYKEIFLFSKHSFGMLMSIAPIFNYFYIYSKKNLFDCFSPLNIVANFNFRQFKNLWPNLQIFKYLY